MLNLRVLSALCESYDDLRADLELKDTLVVAIPKIEGDGYIWSTIGIEYECKTLRFSNCNVFGHILDQCRKKIVFDVLKNTKATMQTVRGVHIGSNSHLVYKPVQPKND